MSKRKTIAVDAIVYTVNAMLKNSTSSPDLRFGAIVLLESILHETGNYKGFSYLTAEEVPVDERPGVNYETDEHGWKGPCANYEARFANTDDTRRSYFYP